MHAVVDSVRRVPSSSVVAVAVTAGDLAVVVESARLIKEPPEGETVTILLDGAEVELSEILWHDEHGGPAQDTLTLAAPGAPADVAVNAEVVVDGEAEYRGLAYVGGGLTPEPVNIPHNFIDKGALQVSTGGLGTVVTLRDDGDGWQVVDVPKRAPSIHMGFAATSTLDLDDATDYDLAADTNFAAAIIRAGDLSGVDLGAAKLSLMSTDGRTVTFDGPQGLISMTNSDGSEAGTLAASANYIQAWVDALTFVAQGTSDFRGDVRFNPGVNVYMMSDYPAPQTGPRCEVGWESVVTYPAPTSVAGSDASLVEDGGTLYTSQLQPARRDGGQSLEVRSFSPAGGETTRVWRAPWTAHALRSGLARVGTSWFLMVSPDTSTYEVREYDDDGGIVGAWTPTNPGSTNVPCVGYDFINDDLLVAWRVTAGNAYVIQSYDTAGSLLGSVTTDVMGFTILDPSTVMFGQFDFGVDRYVIRSGLDQGTWVFEDDGTEDAGNEWTLASWWYEEQTGESQAVVDICWDDTAGVFRELTIPSGVLYTYSDSRLGTGYDPFTAYVGQTFSDGTDETEVSALTQIQMLQRARIDAKGGDLPGWADRRNVYYGEATPRTSLFLQGTPTAGTRAWTLTPQSLSGANPPAASTFAAGTPVELWGVTKIIDGTYNHASDLPTRVLALESGGGGGGGSSNGISIYCGDPTGATVSINCGGP